MAAHFFLFSFVGFVRAPGCVYVWGYVCMCACVGVYVCMCARLYAGMYCMRLHFRAQENARVLVSTRRRRRRRSGGAKNAQTGVFQKNN